jgi:predicted PurR-regulated permease PerM
MNNTNVNPVTNIVDNHSSRSKRKKLSNISSMSQKCLVIFLLLLLIIGLGVLIGVSIIRCFRLTKELKMKEENLFEEQIKNNETIEQLNSFRLMNNQRIRQLETIRSMNNETIQNLTNQLKQSITEKTRINEIIKQLNTSRSLDGQKIQQLNNQLKGLVRQQIKNNQTIQNLIDQLQKSSGKLNGSVENTIPVVKGKQINMNSFINNESTQESSESINE